MSSRVGQEAFSVLARKTYYTPNLTSGTYSGGRPVFDQRTQRSERTLSKNGWDVK